MWFDRDGNQVGALGEPAEYGQPRISPNGKVVAVNRLASEKDAADIWLFDLESNTACPSSLPSRPTKARRSGRRTAGKLVYFSNPNGHFDLYRKSVAGGKAGVAACHRRGQVSERLVAPTAGICCSAAWAPSTNSDLWLLPMKGERKPVTYLQTVSTEGYGQFSPDGKWVAYQSDESGRAEVYVEPSRGAPGQRRPLPDLP